MYTLLTQNTLIKQTHNYDHIPDFNNPHSAIVLKS